MVFTAQIEPSLTPMKTAPVLDNTGAVIPGEPVAGRDKLHVRDEDEVPAYIEQPLRFRA